MMRIQIIIFLISLCLSANGQSSDLFNSWQTFFEQTTSEGQVNYQKAQKLQSLRAQIRQDLSNINIADWRPNEKKAFWINAYNFIVIDQVCQNYPIQSVQQIAGFFDKARPVAGLQLSLDEIEKQQLWPIDQDPRIHFALICGAKSCPPALSHAYRPEDLEAQLLAQCRKSVNGSPQIFRKEEDKWLLSMIFKWYQKDFGGTEGVLNFIKHYSNDEGLDLQPPFQYQDYDWSLNEVRTEELVAVDSSELSLIQTFTPSRLLKKGQWDIKWFHNVYTETSFADENGKVSDLDRRTFYEQRLEIFTSVDQRGRWNFGMVTTARSTMLTNGVNNEQQSHQAIEAVLFPNDGNYSRSGWATVAPSIKWVPFPKLSRLSIQSSLFIPLVDRGESPIFLNFDSYIWENRIFYDKTLGAGQNWQLFSELDLNYTFGPEEGFANPSLFTPATVILSYFPSKYVTIYGLAQHGQRWGNGAQDYTQMGLGLKWQMNSYLNLELLYNQFIRGRSTGLGRSYNVGLRYIRL